MKLFVLTMILIAGSVMAADAPAADGRRAGMHACREDAKKLCSDVKPGEGRIIACLKDNSDKVSEACKAFMEKMKDKQDAGKNMDDEK